MGCNCGGSKDVGMAYKVKIPGQDPQYVDTIGEARLLRAANGPTVIIMRVPEAEAKASRGQ